jgi:hypothetical protein
MLNRVKSQRDAGGIARAAVELLREAELVVASFSRLSEPRSWLKAPGLRTYDSSIVSSSFDGAPMPCRAQAWRSRFASCVTNS